MRQEMIVVNIDYNSGKFPKVFSDTIKTLLKDCMCISK